MDKDSRVILLPKCDLPFKIIQLPSSTNLESFKSYLLQESTLYELSIIDGSTDENIPKLKSGIAIKSFIFEPGYVLQSPNIIICNKFNFTYLLISITKQQQYKKFNDKFIELEDFKDILNIEWIYQLPNELIINSLNLICDVIIQNCQNFYKFNLDKCLKWIYSKILQLKNFIIENNTSIYHKIKIELSPNMEEISIDKLNDLTMLYSLDYITSSYCNLKSELIEKFDFKLNDLNKYLEKLKQSEKNIEIMESNISSLKSSNKIQQQQQQQDNKKKLITKKVIKRGAIDSFFKKKPTK